MKDNIIKSIKDFDSTINIDNLEYSNNLINIKDLISLYKLRLNIYHDKNAPYKEIEFLEKKIHAFNQLDRINISSIKMVNVDNYIFYLDEEYMKIYLIIDNFQKDVKNLW
ncbi:MULTISPECIES: hypothetical protein [Chryseobacterium]|uniref:Uncharacterized protein n=1 Tax=Chryseobacterium camelliae TaxID=1265445 RepID=A0ABU0TNF1_9FLAO|nr:MULTISPECIES: hypothetical protein [Chryseobacterium]MDT3407573.1 hypothetical protein [Pseudacidovorax intermedius]MDQ1098574.1 hypothetical protein [Chryseobacterium camelliae]MDQ1102498.1 hypothetical protein [Chryseobacterium sp. SORGH_AS_1048]MDR6085932.1 hypothetical protein [Chryseobacterium sp. SORGH_AS_0909]MDR6130298.1 hypothetical protein [Chryseobacterium sp. SORGH_AS_1175]